LLAAVHADLFVPNFPDPDEQETPADWTPRLWGDVAPPQPEQHGWVAGRRLTSAGERSLAGFAFVERYRDSRCALLSYIAVDAAHRASGMGRKLFENALGSARYAAERDGRPLRAVFAEIHDPRRVAGAHDVMEPVERARAMARLGGRRVPVTYVQPALGEDAARSDRLLLIAFLPAGATTVEADAVRAFLREYYSALGVEDLDGDEDLARMETELRALGGESIELASLTDA
jgi:GNAT superfamily N-acetyltransferase